jgi:transposase
MLKLEFSTDAIEALRYGRFHHPHPQVQRKMEVVYLRRQGLGDEQIRQLCAISTATFYCYLRVYQAGGVAKLKEVSWWPQGSALNQHRTTLEEYFRAHPPATAAEASAKVEELTGIRRGPTQTRKFLKAMGMKPRQGGQVPSKADPQEQAEWKENKLDPRLAEAQAGQRLVFFMDAAHFVYAPFLALVWCFERVWVKAPSGRQRLNVLAALNAITHEVFTVQNLTYVTAETVCELLRLLAGAHPGMPITLVLDNARYQKCALVQALARGLGIELLYLPAYSPNLNLIERFWKWVKKKSLYSKYYATSVDFHKAIQTCIAQAHHPHRAELKSLLTLRFQTFKEVPVIGEGGKVRLFSGANQPQKKVSSKAA